MQLAGLLVGSLLGGGYFFALHYRYSNKIFIEDFNSWLSNQTWDHTLQVAGLALEVEEADRLLTVATETLEE